LVKPTSWHVVAARVNTRRHDTIASCANMIGSHVAWFGEDTMNISMSTIGRALAVLSTTAALATGCSSQRDSDREVEQQKAAELVAATESAGVAPRLTTDLAESLYGTDAPGVCDLFDGGLSTSAKNVILGNPAQGRRKTVTDEAVVYGRLVVQTYCPDELDDFEDVVAGLGPFDRNDR
jgi:hypothetical protein